MDYKTKIIMEAPINMIQEMDITQSLPKMDM